MRRPLALTALILVLAAGSVLALFWILPFAAVHAGGMRWDLLGWAASPKAGAPELW